MPSQQDIDRFNETLIQLGNEPEILSERGERLEHVSAPEEGLTPDLDALLSDTAVEEGEGGEAAEAPPEGAPSSSDEEAGPEGFDFSGISTPDEFVDLGLDEALEEPEEGEGGEAAEPAAAEEHEEPEAPDEAAGLEETEAPEEGPEPEEDEAFAEAEDLLEELSDEGDEGDEGEEEFELPGDEFFGLEGLEDELEADTEAGAEVPPAEEEEGPEEAAEEEKLGEAEGFEEAEELEEAEEPEAIEEAEELEEAEEPEVIEEAEELVDFGEADEAAAPSGEEGADEFSAEEFSEDEFGGEDFSFDDFDMDLDEEELGEGLEEEAEAEESSEEAAPEEAESFEEAVPAEEAGEEPAEEAAAVEAADFGGESDIDFDLDLEELEEGGEELSPEADEGEEEGVSLPEGGEEFSFEEGGLPEEEMSLEEGPAGEGGGGDDFSFDEPSLDGFGGEDEEAGFGDDFDFAEGGDVDDVDEFNLGDFGAEFGVLEEEPGTPEGEEELNPALEVSEAPEGEVRTAGPAEIELSEEDFDAVKRTLASLPLNLKLEVENAIADEKLDSDTLELLLRQLAEGESAKTIANFLGKALGKQIRIPKGYEKRSGLAFEEERRTFAYAFKENILPILKVVGLAGAALGLLIFLGYRFIYRPIKAQSLYQEGLELVQNDEPAGGNFKFEQAHELWARDPWFFRYAEAFKEKRRFQLAEEKYIQLQVGLEEEEVRAWKRMIEDRDYQAIHSVIDVKREGVLDYGRMLMEDQARYEDTEDLLGLLLETNIYDYDALLMLGDNYMKWAGEDPEKYEDARRSYATLIQRYGDRDQLLFRMLRYFMRTDNEKEVRRLKNYFQSDTGKDINPEIYAELGGYLIDKNDLEDVSSILLRVLAQDQYLPEAHYHLARYFRRSDEPFEEEKALKNSRTLLNEEEHLNAEQYGMLADTYGRLGEYYFEREKYINAAENLEEGIETYEEALESGFLEAEARYGRLYAVLGDISYYPNNNLQEALRLYQKAEANRYRSPLLNYKKGYIHYSEEEYEDALIEFNASAPSSSVNRNYLYAMGNTLFHRRQYFAAQGHYSDLLAILMNERNRIRNLFIDEDPEHRALVEYIYKVENNLGAALYHLTRRTEGSDAKLSDALRYLTNSSEDFVNYHRDRETLARPEIKDLGYLNQRYILYPEQDYEVMIYTDLPKDLSARFF
jgi:tetratricopeptide (TPR) repeat protein